MASSCAADMSPAMTASKIANKRSFCGSGWSGWSCWAGWTGSAGRSSAPLSRSLSEPSSQKELLLGLTRGCVHVSFPANYQNTMESEWRSSPAVASRHVNDTPPPHRRRDAMRSVFCMFCPPRRREQHGDHSKTGSLSLQRGNGSTMGDLHFECPRDSVPRGRMMTAVRAAGGTRAGGIGPSPARRGGFPNDEGEARRLLGRGRSPAAAAAPPRRASPQAALRPGMGGRREYGPTRGPS